MGGKISEGAEAAKEKMREGKERASEAGLCRAAGPAGCSSGPLGRDIKRDRTEEGWEHSGEVGGEATEGSLSLVCTPPNSAVQAASGAAGKVSEGANAGKEKVGEVAEGAKERAKVEKDKAEPSHGRVQILWWF